MQRLIMPFKRQMMLCGYKAAPYKKHHGYPHYGVDISSIQGGAGDDPTIYASGDGIVLDAGRDNSLGYGICILYSGAYNHQTGQRVDVVARYMHMPSVMVKTGDVVKQGAPLAVEGNIGPPGMDYHLHIEFDTDIQWPRWSPQVSEGHTFWQKGADSTLNPSHLLHVGEGQVIVKPTYNPAWLNPEDFAIPGLPEQAAPVTFEQYKALKDKYNDLEIRHNSLVSGMEALIGKYGKGGV